MLIGPNLFFKCPECGKMTVRGSILSGNTFLSRLFSDGKLRAPMLPEFPGIVKCKKCKNFYWLNDKNEIGAKRKLWAMFPFWAVLCVGGSLLVSFGFPFWLVFGLVFWLVLFVSLPRFADAANFLSVDEYIEAINLSIYKNDKEELYLRQRLWWAFNDRIREGENFIANDDDKDVYESNCIKLIEMLDKNNINEKIMCAELFRNLGNYIECNNIWETIKEEQYTWIKELLQKECEKKNKNVIELVEPMEQVKQVEDVVDHFEEKDTPLPEDEDKFTLVDYYLQHPFLVIFLLSVIFGILKWHLKFFFGD